MIAGNGGAAAADPVGNPMANVPVPAAVVSNPPVAAVPIAYPDWRVQRENRRMRPMIAGHGGAAVVVPVGHPMANVPVAAAVAPSNIPAAAVPSIGPSCNNYIQITIVKRQAS